MSSVRRLSIHARCKRSQCPDSKEFRVPTRATTKLLHARQVETYERCHDKCSQHHNQPGCRCCKCSTVGAYYCASISPASIYTTSIYIYTTSIYTSSIYTAAITASLQAYTASHSGRTPSEGGAGARYQNGMYVAVVPRAVGSSSPPPTKNREHVRMPVDPTGPRKDPQQHPGRQTLQESCRATTLEHDRRTLTFAPCLRGRTRETTPRRPR